MTSIIGISGKARVGKDTFAAVVVEAIQGYRYGFADPIKRMTDVLVPRGTDDQKELVIPEFGKSRRQLWQTLGTEWGRQMIHPDIWLTVAGWELERNGPGMVISDVRFENEATWIRRRGGVIVHISRPNRELVHGSQTHKSEAGIESRYGDYKIFNDGDLASFLQQGLNFATLLRQQFA